MKMSESIANISVALVQFQSEVKNPEKKGVNPHFKSKYAELDVIINTIRPTLEKNGLAFIQNPVHEEGQVGVYTLLIHKSGEFIQFDPVMIPLQKATPHQVGAALTYAKRYSLGSALGLATEEDKDGNDVTPQSSQKQLVKRAIKQAIQKEKQADEGRRKLGIEKIKELKREKELTDEEFSTILKAEVNESNLEKLTFDQVKQVYRTLAKSSPEDLKEAAKAFLAVSQQ